MKAITFPKNEWEDIKARLNEGKIVYTIRVGNEYGKYRVGDILETEWGSQVKILSVEKITGGLKALEDKYIHFNKLTEGIIKELSGYDNMEIITLKAWNISR